jgi:osmotically inducible protein OsmC
MATDRRAEVRWQGSLMDGSGVITSTTSGVIGEQPVSWPSRAEDGPKETSPEELIAAAHAACFSMALSHALAQGGNPADELNTSATVTFQPGQGITKIALTVRGSVPGLDASAFEEVAETAKANCPVSKALAGVPEITLDASLA